MYQKYKSFVEDQSSFLNNKITERRHFTISLLVICLMIPSVTLAPSIGVKREINVTILSPDNEDTIRVSHDGTNSKT